MLIGHGAAHLSHWHFAGVADTRFSAATFAPATSRKDVSCKRRGTQQKERDEHGRD